MATTFGTIYDAIRTICSTTLGTNLELPNPYELERNAPNQLEQGWGITWGSSTVFTDQFHTTCEEIPFSLVLTASTAGPEMDPGRIAGALKVIKQMDLDTRKLIVVPDNIGVSNANVLYTGSSEVSFIEGDPAAGPLATQDVVAVISMNYIARIYEALV